MKKKTEMEVILKDAIRDHLALNPFISVRKMSVQLHLHGYHSASDGIMDWHYISRLMKEVRIENVAKLSPENRIERLVALKERHRVLTSLLLPIAKGERSIYYDKIVEPTFRDQIAAANTILKWDKELLFAESQLNLLNRTQSIEKKRTRAMVLIDQVSEKRSFSQSHTQDFRDKRTESPIPNKKDLVKQ